MKQQVIIADDNPIFRDALKNMLTDSNLEIVAEAGNGRETLEKVEELNPDLLLLDIGMPNLNGFDVLKLLRKSHPDLKIIMLTMYKDLSDQSFKLGANGYCTKDTSPNDLLAGIERVLEGGTFCSAD